jgi:glycosyltransferase involved in cell wall biosynthesis
LRLLIITHYFWPEDFRINELTAELVKRGHRVTVLTARPNYPGGRLFPAFVSDPAAFSSYQGASIMRVRAVTRGEGGAVRLILGYVTLAASTTVAALWRFRRGQFDAAFVFEPSPITVGLPAIALRAVTGLPIVFWVLDQWPETLSAVGAVRSPWIIRALGALSSFIYNRCDLVLGQSRSMVEQIRGYCDTSERVMYFPNWAEGGYANSATEPAAEVPRAEGCFSIMFAGNVGESQDFPAILDAAERLAGDSRIRWLIVGDGRRAPWVRDEIGRRRLQRRVLMLGRHPLERMPSFYRHADALLVSLKPEPIFAVTVPGKIQSYLAFGLPILGMLDGEGADVINDAEAGLTCRAGDSAALAENVRRMASMSAAERQIMSANGRAYARREFDRDMLVARLEGWLERLARTARRPSSAS